MKYLEEYRDANLAHKLLKSILHLVEDSHSKITLMEVCGTHTMNIARAGIRRLLKDRITLLSGPGCPVCVTPYPFLDQAIAYSRSKDVIIASFGDMIKVPGSSSSLEREKAKGAEIQIVYSPLDALKTARENPNRKIVFLGVGFETTAPAVAATIMIAREQKIQNFLVLCGHKLVPPAMKALVMDPDLRIDGFLCPGHVSAIIGSKPYEFIARDHGVPCVIAGFEPLDILQSLEMLVRQITDGTSRVEIQYSRVVKEEGNPRAMDTMLEVFEPVDSTWRGLGMIPQSGLRIRGVYGGLDASVQIPVHIEKSAEPPGCICGQILKGAKNPTQCPLYRKFCSPENPVGACMVSTEGTCAAYYKYEE